MAKRKIKGYTRGDGVKVRGHHRVYKKKRGSSKSYKAKYTPAQRRAHVKSRTSKSGHKTYKERLKSKRPGLWTNYWNKRRREGTWKPRK